MISSNHMDHSGKALIDPYLVFEKIGLNEGMRVADLGCGRTGQFVFPTSRIVGDTGVVYAVDIIKDILENIQSRARTEGYDNVQTVWSDIEKVGKMTIPDASVDACFIVNVLFMVKDRAGALAEAVRLLKSGGKLVIIDWARNLGPLGPTAGLMLSADNIKNLASKLSLKFDLEFAPGDYHYCLVFKKL